MVISVLIESLILYNTLPDGKHEQNSRAVTTILIACEQTMQQYSRVTHNICESRKLYMNPKMITRIPDIHADGATGKS